MYSPNLQVEGHKKYTEQPPKYLPSEHIEHKRVSKETFKEMNKRDQKRLQPSGAVLSIDALERHDMKHTTGPSQLRQFGCPKCQQSWWRHVLKSKPVSRCKGKECGNARYDALPRDKEFGIGRCLCSNELCGREFYAYCEASETLKCRKCKSDCKPLIHPMWRRRARKALNPDAKPFTPPNRRSQQSSYEDLGPTGPHFMPMSQASDDDDLQYDWGGYDLLSGFSDMDLGGGGGGGGGASGGARRGGPLARGGGSGDRGAARGSPPTAARKQKKEKRRIFNASSVHDPSGGTVSTFLSQVDFDDGNGTEVDLDYDSDDDDEKVGVCKLECDCGNEYTVVMKMVNQAKCHHCGRINNPLRWEPPRGILKTSSAKHSCSLCNGHGHCPNLSEARLSQDD